MCEKELQRRERERKDKSANRFSLFTKRRRGTRVVACTWERERMKGTDYMLHVVLLVVVVTDDHNMDCVLPCKTQISIFHSQLRSSLFYLLFNRPKFNFCLNYQRLLIICDFIPNIIHTSKIQEEEKTFSSICLHKSRTKTIHRHCRQLVIEKWWKVENKTLHNLVSKPDYVLCMCGCLLNRYFPHSNGYFIVGWSECGLTRTRKKLFIIK